MITTWLAALIMGAAALVMCVALWLGRNVPGRHQPLLLTDDPPPRREVTWCARCDAELTYQPDRPALGVTAGWYGGPGGLDCHGIGGGWHAPVVGGYAPMQYRERGTGP